jgi:putative ABC transport system permease protein
MGLRGVVSARRAMARWAWRLFRREWRQQVLVLLLLIVAVAAATFSGAAVFNFTGGPEGEFGSAEHRLEFKNSDPAATATDLAAAEEHFGTIDVIASQFVHVPGSVENVELRAQNPQGAYSAPMLSLWEGRYPNAANEVAVTDSVAETFELGIGDSLSLEGRSWNVVGLVENPNNLDDDFALVSKTNAERSHEVTILVGGSVDRLEDFRDRMTIEGNVLRESRDNNKAEAAALTFSLATVGMLLVALIAAAGFVVMAQRRMRQLGMLAAIGASERHVRLVTLANGFLVGVMAAVLGTGVGLLVWFMASGRVEEAAAHRIDGLSVPLWLIGASMLLAVVTATASAWLPARTVARIPITLALSSRAPSPKPVHRSTLLAGVLISIGVVSFALANQRNVPLSIVGTLTIPLGILLIAPLAIRTLAAPAARLPIAGRLALRDLVRYQARSGAALAAITLGLGIAVSVVAAASAAEYDADEGNLSDRQLMIRIGNSPEAFVIPTRSPSELETMDAEVSRFAATLDGAAVIDLQMVLDPSMPPDPGIGDPGDQQAAVLGRRTSSCVEGLGMPSQCEQFDTFNLYLATPELVERAGENPASIDSHDVLTSKDGDFVFFGLGKKEPTPVTNVAKFESPGYSSLPHSFISPAAARSLDWERIRAGWLIETTRSLTDDELAAAREMAAASGLVIEARDDQSRLSHMRSGATAAGGLLALGILAMTVGLIRSEAAGDLRTLTATGATSGIRRNLTAVTAGVLALLGALLGTMGAYVSLSAGDLSGVGKVPVPHLIAIIVGVPIAAAVCGWLLAGREQPFMARRALE